MHVKELIRDHDKKLRLLPRNINGARWWIGLLAVVGVLVGASTIAGAVAAQNPYHDNCAVVKSDPKTSAHTGTPGPALETGEVAQLKFGRRSGSKSVSLLLDNPAKSIPVVKVVNDFLRSDGTAHFPGSDIRAAVNGEDSKTAPNVLQLTVCANRTMSHADPGTYTGDLLIATGKANTRVPVTISLSDTHTQAIVTILFSLVLLFGSAYTWALEKKITADQNVLGLKAVQRYLTWLTTLGGVVSVAAGLAAAITVFNAQYLAPDVWGTSAKDYFSLLGAVFVSFIGAATISRLPGMAATTPPTVTAVVPVAGPAAGGARVLLAGTGFAGAIAVAFGNALGTDIDIQNDNVINVTTPEHAAGDVDVTVTTAAGSSSQIAADKFTYE